MARQQKMGPRVNEALQGVQVIDTMDLARRIGIKDDDVSAWDKMQHTLENLRIIGRIRFSGPLQERVLVVRPQEVSA